MTQNKKDYIENQIIELENKLKMLKGEKPIQEEIKKPIQEEIKKPIQEEKKNPEKYNPEKYNVVSDCCQQLYNDDDKIKLVSYGLVGYYGACGVGKTYQMNQTALQYIEQASKSQYDLSKPTINNGEITYNFYISPSIKNDMTMRGQQDKTIYIVANDDNVTAICKLIVDMGEDMSKLLQLQHALLFQTNSLNNQQKLQIINNIEKTKKKYPELKFKTELGKQFYESLGLQYDGFLLRRQKIMIRFDDYQGSSITTKTRNAFYQLLINRRHLGVWYCGLVFHTFSNATDNLRTLQNFTILFQGMDYSQIIEMFGQLPKLQTDNFGEKEFLDLYKGMSKQTTFNFMVIEHYPEIYLGISWGENQAK